MNEDNLGGELKGIAFRDTTRTAQMEAYDKLPWSVRQAIEDLPLKIDVVEILQAYEEDGERNTLANLRLNKRIMMRAIENEKMSLLPETNKQKENHQGS